MRSFVTAQFRNALAKLPGEVQQQARQAYGTFRQDPSHASLRFKLIGGRGSVWSVRIGLHYRAIGVRDKDTIVWFWIGSHSDYDGLLNRR